MDSPKLQAVGCGSCMCTCDRGPGLADEDEAGHAHRGFQLTTYDDRTKPDASTKECRGLMIMSGVGRTYSSGPSSGYRSGSHSSTGMLYLTSCARARDSSHEQSSRPAC